MAKVTGIGGVFFKAAGKKDALLDWYKKNLGMEIEPWGGSVLRWEADKADDKGLTVWNPADKDTTWFRPSESTFMINYRIDNMKEMLEQLKANKVEIVQGPETHENGQFLWIMDPDGNKVELWEPKLWDDSNKQ